mgnify:CR=1 FL=1
MQSFVYLNNKYVNFKNAKIHIEDSIVWSSRILPNNSNYQSYNLVSIDNPLGVFGKSYCENFNIIENRLRELAFLNKGIRIVLSDFSAKKITISPRMGDATNCPKSLQNREIKRRTPPLH